MVDLSIILCANDHKTGNGTGERRRTITVKPTGTSETLAQLRLKRCRDEDLDELDDEAMKHIVNLRTGFL